MGKSAKTIFTIGHSNKPLWFFRLKLLQNEIDLVVDVRTIPQSRFCPHFNKNALQRALWDKRIKYLWLGKNLGGRGINENYEAAIAAVTDFVESGLRVCLLCSEADPNNCHRQKMLQPSFEKRGLVVFHILYEKSKKPGLFE